MAVATKARVALARKPAEPETSANRAAQEEIQNFLEAVNSYPESFARNPKVSFEEHLVMVAAAGHGGSGGN